LNQEHFEMIATPAAEARRIRMAAWLGTAVLVLLPLMIIRAIDPSAWQLADLPFAVVMIIAVGLTFEVALRLPAHWTLRAGIALAAGTAFMLTWGNLAVGFAGSEDNAINGIFFAIPLIALVGSAIARFRAAGVAVALAACAGAQVLAGVVVLFYGHFTGPLTVSFAALWLASAFLFRRHAREARQRPIAVAG
jgi:hypothetical protein